MVIMADFLVYHQLRDNPADDIERAEECARKDDIAGVESALRYVASADDKQCIDTLWYYIRNDTYYIICLRGVLMTGAAYGYLDICGLVKSRVVGGSRVTYTDVIPLQAFEMAVRNKHAHIVQFFVEWNAEQRESERIADIHS